MLMSPLTSVGRPRRRCRTRRYEKNICNQSERIGNDIRDPGLLYPRMPNDRWMIAIGDMTGIAEICI